LGESEPITFAAAAVTRLRDVITASGAYSGVEAITTARVPIIKLTHVATGVECDVCVNQTMALHNSLLLKCYSCVDPRVRPFVLMVKRWAKLRDLSDASNGTLSSYAWACLAIFYLQQPLFSRRDGGGKLV
jgi:DNA polymerase sigma